MVSATRINRLMDVLKESLAGTSGTTLLPALFEGVYRNLIVCDPSADLPVGISAGALAAPHPSTLQRCQLLALQYGSARCAVLVLLGVLWCPPDWIPEGAVR